MRLLDSRSLQFKVYYGDVPPYAILSHTWGQQDEEATFQDLRAGTGADKPEYAKIKACCTQAIQDGFDYVWIDTCCIDKTDSVELQEAISSMFNWYKKSAICYAYLFDYSAPASQPLDLDQLKASKWFTRGWTLQELIAPSVVVFYNRLWEDIGSKAGRQDILSEITRISTKVLAGEDLSLSSVAQRMSWASMRKTTREEDAAYCLLGIFGVNIPLMYGEGGKEAFIRLQETIMLKSDDHSLFAWKQQAGSAARTGQGLLASSPAFFAESASFVQNRGSGSRSSYSMTNRGLCIELSLTCKVHGGDHMAFFGCEDSADHSIIGIHLAVLPDGRFLRTALDQLPRQESLRHTSHKKPPILTTLYIPQQYLSEDRITWGHHFRVVKKVSTDLENRNVYTKDVFKGVASSILPRPIQSMIQPAYKSSPLGFYLASTTLAGRTDSNDSLEFDLKVGGLAGLLFGSVTSRAASKLVPSSRLPFVAIVIGFDQEEGAYCDILDVSEEIYKSANWTRRWGNKDSDVKTLGNHKASIMEATALSSPSHLAVGEGLERYLLDYQREIFKKKQEKDIRGLKFCSEVKDEVVGDKTSFLVEISYSPNALQRVQTAFLTARFFPHLSSHRG
jgi:Heterokaryon incompatibility protein (HET)